MFLFEWLHSNTQRSLIIGPLLLLVLAVLSAGSVSAQTLPRTADGKPNLQGIWRAVNRAGYDLEGHAPRYDMPAGRSVVDGGLIPYQPWAAEQRRVNFESRASADPLSNCFLPGVPRVTSLEFPFHIFYIANMVLKLN